VPVVFLIKIENRIFALSLNKQHMRCRIILLAKQVPDTRNVGKDAMKADGTVNRAALPAVFNPEDLNALELALRIKDQIRDCEIIVLTMGPMRAAEVIREAMYRGADKGFLITDRRFAGSDTLATSYALSQAIRKLEPYHLVIAGRQAIDGDTAQVGPQTAEKLGIPQVTYAEEILQISESDILIKRRLENGVELVRGSLPLAITVHSSAPACRPRIAKRLMTYKHARTLSELQEESRDYTELYSRRPYLLIEEWNVEDIHADVELLGLSGSPTKVKKIENVVFQQKESNVISDSDEDIGKMMKHLIDSHVIG
jgi:electron transfer flavoprotein beta subunit